MKITEAAGALLQLFFPHICAGCGTDNLNREQLLCLTCLHQLPVSDFHRHAGNPTEMIFRGRLPILSAMSYLYFTKDSLPQRLLHQFKYKGKKEVGAYFGKRIGEALLQSGRFPNVDALVPLPLFAGKEKKRGYNQSAILCNHMAQTMQVPVWHHIIDRSAARETQTHKNRLERWENMRDSFILKNPAAIRYKHLLLVDDVITTGATLEACGRELLRAPGVQLSIATMACTAR